MTRRMELNSAIYNKKIASALNILEKIEAHFIFLENECILKTYHICNTKTL